ncbi:hypothetical protein J7E50_21405 [Pedobacter sp. ISL-68]|uniref:hypothetical protein n=1 Tax=unclassified Pedobacter TaxID=2628915 RepID=UPI001BE80D0D|nr:MULTISPECIES: hypothetical protein [unclassified Pedobacter]MBT2563804.1 hypothetical protein [Pedobacter sp. ISL-64]MBT2592790.1 hypothetical protein [Pedobacter sp. ISL-68]
MNYSYRSRIKFTARFLLALWLLQLVQPISTWALTSGPSQPEAQSFQPVGVSDMVDLFSGDFKYNIPLMDIDGYPINLNYQSGTGIDDEASWVGLGWNLNVGAINRQLRGIPDDFNGDKLKTQHYTKAKVTVGGRLTARAEWFGGAKVRGSFSFGVFSDNYTGMGAEISANAGMSFSLANDGMLTAGMGIGVLSNTSSGVDVTPNISLSIFDNKREKGLLSSSFSSSLGYNSRSGLKSLSFGHNLLMTSTSNTYNFNTEPIMPKIQYPYFSDYSSFSVDVGGALFGGYAGVGGTGYRNIRSVVNDGKLENPEYGFLYSEMGKDTKNAVHDFLREKENPVIPELPNLALPIGTPDVFSYNSQAGSGQFRLYRGGTGVYFDNEVNDASKTNTAGFDIGVGGYAHGGVAIFNQRTSNVSRKWTANNNYLKNGDFQKESLTDPKAQHVFFKHAGENNVEDKQLSDDLGSVTPLMVSTSGKTANAAFKKVFGYNSTITESIPVLAKKNKEVQSSVVSYLTAAQAAKVGMDKQIKHYNFIDEIGFNPAQFNPLSVEPTKELRDTGYRQKHHISELTVTSGAGQRMVYGIPVYNLAQEEISFALANTNDNRTGRTDIVNINPLAPHSVLKTDGRGIDDYFHTEKQPAYAYSYLISGILSPDYVDKTSDGITSDDDGTAIKFNYSRISNYRWRTPYGNKKSDNTHVPEASLNRGQLADPDDDKGSIVYGEKEIYYVHSIESKNKVAFFITKDRDDALGVKSWQGEPSSVAKQKQLVEIRLYSKHDYSKPIKVVKFKYGYDLCKSTPNSAAEGGGKLTLQKVWFEYGNTHKGSNHPYAFNYNKGLNNNNPEVRYGVMNTDRWGTYKQGANPGGLNNEEYPYADQDETRADEAAGLWNISSIGLPSGGKIAVTYEADDYAYVQNKRAAVMVPYRLNNGGADEISLTVDEQPPSTERNKTRWFKKNYLNGSDYIYTKSTINLGNSNAPAANGGDDFVPAYCRVDSVHFEGSEVKLILEQISESDVTTNPIRFAAWQKLKNDYPKFAYPGYQNRVEDNGSGFEAAITAIFNASGNLKELRENFYQKAKRKGYGSNIDVSRSFARISLNSKAKIGGGARVKKIAISDEWSNLSGSAARSGSYGQSYTYTTKDDTGRQISSGVAAYEPSVGSDENALRQPVPYVQKIKGAINNYFELEEPFGESLYPGASVGYSKVTVVDLDQDGNEILIANSPKTGYVVNEFYTAKDFPVRVTAMPMQKYNPRPQQQYSIISTNSIEEMILSQGYMIELNDMHGKPKSNRIFNQSGAEISSSVYEYQVDNPKAVEKRLNNNVSIINAKGQVGPGVIGRDIELFTDFREQESSNNGTAINFGGDVIPLPFFGIPIFIPHLPFGTNSEYKLFRSACAVKVIHTNGLIKKVIKTENGSSIAVENVAYDGVTGEALVTKTQNEFKQDYYSVNLPAYWMYKGMGAAYQNLGTMVKDFNTGTNGVIQNATYSSFVMPGDEWVDVALGTHYWVIETAGAKRLIDREGKTVTVNIPLAKIIRSGYRNILGTPTTSVVCMENPIQGSQFKLVSTGDLSSLKVISTSVNLFDEAWVINNFNSSIPAEIIEDKSLNWYMRENEYVPSSGASACVDTEPVQATNNLAAYLYCNIAGSFFNSPGRLKASNVCPVEVNWENTYEFSMSFTVPQTKTYYVGAGRNGSSMSYIFDCTDDGITYVSPVNQWTVLPVYLTAGVHKITMTIPKSSLPNEAIGVELYNNTLQQIQNAGDGSGINIIFSTAQLRGNIPTQSSTVSTLFQSSTYSTLETYFRANYRTYHYSYSNGQPVGVCDVVQPGTVKIINPYIQGFIGNWRPYQSKVYQTTRKYNDVFTAGKRGMDLKKTGFLTTYTSWWSNANGGGWIQNPTSNWVNANTVTLYDKYGQELENKDALNRYSAAKFDFNGELPAAVASNAMNREVYINSFEDYRSKFNSDSVAFKNKTIKGELYNPVGDKGLTNLIDSTVSHSGRSSLNIYSTGILLDTKIHAAEHKTAGYLSSSATGYSLLGTTGLYPNGFEPMPNKEYLFNVWVKDNNPLIRSTDLNINIKGDGSTLTPVDLKCKAIVEGWKLMEGTIYTGGSFGDIPGATLQLIVKSTNGVKLDDIRIHPKAAHLKSYAYDSRSFKLMAELDENAFATFYEYDDEGSLVRVKKETERGIATIKESRSSYRKN